MAKYRCIFIFLSLTFQFGEICDFALERGIDGDFYAETFNENPMSS
jgi:hypothetical protein